MQQLIKYSINESKSSDIENHLIKCSTDFMPPLETYIDIASYAIKLEKLAYRLEAWVGEELISLVACYLNNDETKEGFISNVSTLNSYQGKGIAKSMLDCLFKYATQKKIKTLSLEVYKYNNKAIDFYTSIGFHEISSSNNGKYLLMTKELNNKNNGATYS
ncbi:MAG: GNAT family N-acetyltransferase [Tissierellia bacterium]|nr:GNAT family N-acetyltransferase [Tissierellia bacterium]